MRTIASHPPGEELAADREWRHCRPTRTLASFFSGEYAGRQPCLGTWAAFDRDPPAPSRARVRACTISGCTRVLPNPATRRSANPFPPSSSPPLTPSCYYARSGAVHTPCSVRVRVRVLREYPRGASLLGIQDLRYVRVSSRSMAGFQLPFPSRLAPRHAREARSSKFEPMSGTGNRPWLDARCQIPVCQSLGRHSDAVTQQQ